MKRLLDEYIMLKSQKQYLKMILANIINRFGDSVDAIAFTWLVFELTHSPAWSTIIYGVNMIPTILLQPFCGALVEKMNKRNIMTICDLARGLAVCSIAYCYVIGILTPWLLLVITIFNSSVEAFRVPSGMAIVPKLLDKEHYDSGIALNSSLSRVFELIGTGCAGIIIAITGVFGAIVVDAVTFFASALIIACIRYRDEIKKVKVSFANYWITLKEGFHYIRVSKVIIIICITGAVLNMITVPMNTFLPAYIDGVLHAGSEMLSAINMSITIGLILGSFFYPSIAKLLKRRTILLITTWYLGIFYLGFILIPSYCPISLLSNGLILILNLILGFVISMLNTSISVLLMSLVDETYLARVSAVFGAGLMTMIPVSSLLITFALQITNYITILVVIGILTLVFGIILTNAKSLKILNSEQS